MPNDIGPEVYANESKEAILSECPGGEHSEQGIEQHDLHHQHSRDLVELRPAVKNISGGKWARAKASAEATDTTQ
jgi:hypothetical protein